MADLEEHQHGEHLSLREAMIPVGSSHVFAVEAGPLQGPAVVFLHGWPQSHRAWRSVMQRAAAVGFRAIALDLPGIGRSGESPTDGSTVAIATVVHGLIDELSLEDVTLVGHDLGGMVVYSSIRHDVDVARAVIMDTVVPGIDPWDQVLANPAIWHFAFHAIPDLPEILVQGKQRAYFDYFFNALSARRNGVSDASREAYAAAYASDDALRAGFNWYRMLGHDAEVNANSTGLLTTPLLYLRGEHEGGKLDDYVAGFHKAGVANVESATIPGAGHFAPEDAPDEVWTLIASFVARHPLRPDRRPPQD